MSARLIKVTSDIPTQIFAPFSMPEDDRPAMPEPFERGVTFTDEPETEAERIVAEARVRAADIERQAHEDGRAARAAEVAAEVSRVIDPWQEQLTDTLAELAGLRLAISAQAERDLIRLSLEIAKKIVHREVAIDPDVVMALARIGLSRVHNRTAASIHLHPEDLAYVTIHRAKLKGGHELELVEDLSIERGGCLIHTEMGDVDARIEEQFAEIETALLET
jgi:flagellar assembly protein FliH